MGEETGRAHSDGDGGSSGHDAEAVHAKASAEFRGDARKKRGVDEDRDTELGHVGIVEACLNVAMGILSAELPGLSEGDILLISERCVWR